MIFSNSLLKKYLLFFDGCILYIIFRMVNQHRDSHSSYMGHYDLMNYFAICENEAKARVRFNLMERMLQPCGPPPEKPED